MSSACSQVTLRSEMDTLPLDVVARHDVPAALRGQDAQEIDDVGVLEVHGQRAGRRWRSGVVVAWAITAGWGTGAGISAVGSSLGGLGLAGSGLPRLGRAILAGSGLTRRPSPTGLRGLDLGGRASGRRPCDGLGLPWPARLRRRRPSVLGVPALAGSGGLRRLDPGDVLADRSGFTASALTVSGLGSALAASTFLGAAFADSGLAGSVDAVEEGSSTTRRGPSALCSIRYPTLRVSSTTTRAVPHLPLATADLLDRRQCRGSARVLSHA